MHNAKLAETNSPPKHVIISKVTIQREEVIKVGDVKDAPFD